MCVNNKWIYNVAPLVGAWIETFKIKAPYNKDSVAPLVGAWIETTTISHTYEEGESRSPRGGVD